MNRPLIIGLTGGIGCGKTTVSECFAQHGVPIIDTDLLAREAVAPGSPVLANILQAWGSALCHADGQLNRQALRECVFADPQRKQQLEAWIHPEIERLFDLRIHALPRETHYAIAVIPLLIEAKWQNKVDRILVVDCPEDLQRHRVLQRDGNNAKLVDSILATQCTRQQRLAVADETIDNSHADMDRLEQQIIHLDRHYRRIANEKSNSK